MGVEDVIDPAELPPSGGVPGVNGDAKGLGLLDGEALRDHRCMDELPVGSAKGEFAGDVLRRGRSQPVHDDGGRGQPWVLRSTQARNCLEWPMRPLDGEEAGLSDDDCHVSGSQCVDRRLGQGWRGVDDDDVVGGIESSKAVVEDRSCCQVDLRPPARGPRARSGFISRLPRIEHPGCVGERICVHHEDALPADIRTMSSIPISFALDTLVLEE